MASLDHSTVQPEVAPLDLEVPLDTVCYIIALARDYDGKSDCTDPSASGMDEDDMALGILEDRPSDPVEEELISIISDLSLDAQMDLVALMWLGRDGTSIDDWPELRAMAEDHQNGSTAGYLCGTPMLCDHLAAGLDLIGLNCGTFNARYG